MNHHFAAGFENRFFSSLLDHPSLAALQSAGKQPESVLQPDVRSPYDFHSIGLVALLSGGASLEFSGSSVGFVEPSMVLRLHVPAQQVAEPRRWKVLCLSQSTHPGWA